MSIFMVAFYHHPQQAAESVGGYGGGWLEKVAEDSEWGDQQTQNFHAVMS